MKQLEQLPQIAEDLLGGLSADTSLKEEILSSAASLARGEKVKPRCTPWARHPARANPVRMALRRSAALVCAAAFVLGFIFGLPALLTLPAGNSGLIDVQQGGSELPGGGTSRALDVPRGSLVISKQEKPAYRGVWAASTGGNFPLIFADGRYYRLMTVPTQISSDLLGASLGTVATFTSEPALVTEGIVSNTVAQGETVYTVKGMQGALVAAPVDGTMRLFQRVSFGSSALRSGETLKDTLCAGTVVAMELTGVGTVTDSTTAQSLYQTLLSNAQLSRSGASETNQSLLIQLKNGIVLQLSVRDESVMACGTWLCPEFFEAFAAAVQ